MPTYLWLVCWEGRLQRWGAGFETRTSPFKMDRGLSCNGFALAEALGAAWHRAGAEEAGAVELLSAFLRI